MALLDAVGNSFMKVAEWVQLFVNYLVKPTGRLHDLLPLFAIGISISAIMLGIKIVRSITWGS